MAKIMKLSQAEGECILAKLPHSEYASRHFSSLVFDEKIWEAQVTIRPVVCYYVAVRARGVV